MIIRKIELDGYCQHSGRVIDVSGNLIAVVGHNGVGKSNMLGAIQFALTGEQPGKTKADLLKWGAKEGKVVLEFEQDGKPGRIERYVSSNKVTLEYDGTTTSGATNVAKEMETRLHMDKDIVRQSVFVRQTEVDTIISAKTDRRDREVAFQKLLGIDAARIHKNLTDWAYQAVKPLNYDVQIADAVSHLDSLSERKRELDAEAAKAREALDSLPSPEWGDTSALQSKVTDIMAVISAADMRDHAVSAEEECVRRLKSSTDAAASLGENPGIDVSEAILRRSQLSSEVWKCDELARRDAEAADAWRVLTAAQEKDHPSEGQVKGATDRHNAAVDALSALKKDMDTHRKAIGTVDGTHSACPVCGSPITADVKTRLMDELSGMELREAKMREEVSALFDEMSDVSSRLSAWKNTLSVASAKAEAASRVLDDFKKSSMPTMGRDEAASELELLNKAIAAQQEYDAKSANFRKGVESAKSALAAAVRNREHAEAVLREAEEKAVASCGSEAAGDWKAARESLLEVIGGSESEKKRRDAAHAEVVRLSAAYDEVARSIESMGATVRELKERQKEQDELAKRMAVIERVRDWFHYQNGPRVLVTQVLEALTDDVNRFLGNFTAPFIVTPDREQLGFRVQFTDGRDSPEDPPGTDVLSGGERVQLAVAFRLAIYCMFAGKLGLLSLDEPTAYLDDGNVDRFGVLLGKVRELARNMNTQVFMATHERSVIPHMDSVIDLN